MTKMLQVIAIAAILASVAPAAAQTRPTLRPEIAVASDLVRIGDLIANAGAAADTAIFRAPDLGQTGTVKTARIVEAIRPHRLIDIDTGGLTEVIVNRASRIITLNEIEEHIAAALAARSGIADVKDIGITLDRDARPLHIEPAAGGELRIAHAMFDASGRFDVTFDLSGKAAGQRTRPRYTGTATETVEFATVAREVPRGDVIHDADVMIERKPRAAVGSNAFGKAEQLVGWAAKRTLRTGQPLRAADVMKPQLVRQHEPVTLVYEAPGLLLRVRGKAVESGAEGDVVNVINVQSKRTVQGTVSGPGRVTVLSLAPRVIDVGIDRTASLPPPARPRAE